MDDVGEGSRSTVVKRIAINPQFLFLKPESVQMKRLLIAFDTRPVNEAIKLSSAIIRCKCAPEGRTGKLMGRIIVTHST